MPSMTVEQRDILYNKIISELPNHKTFKALAKACGVGESTLWHYRKNDAVFKEMWEERIREIVENSQQILMDSSDRVAEALVEVATEGKLPERIPGIKLYYDNLKHKMSGSEFKAVQINVEF